MTFSFRFRADSLADAQKSRCFLFACPPAGSLTVSYTSPSLARTNHCLQISFQSTLGFSQRRGGSSKVRRELGQRKGFVDPKRRGAESKQRQVVCPFAKFLAAIFHGSRGSVVGH